MRGIFDAGAGCHYLRANEAPAQQRPSWRIDLAAPRATLGLPVNRPVCNAGLALAVWRQADDTVISTPAKPLLCKLTSGGFSFVRVGPVKYTKPALTYGQQAAQLISRGLLCDREELLRRLRSVSYYRLSGYWYPFRRLDDTFLEGTTLESVWRRYRFDRRLRLVVLDAIERVEICIRTELVYLLAHTQGPFGFSLFWVYSRPCQ